MLGLQIRVRVTLYYLQAQKASVQVQDNFSFRSGAAFELYQTVGASLISSLSATVLH